MSGPTWHMASTPDRAALHTRAKPPRWKGTKAELLAHLRADHGLAYFGPITRAELEAEHGAEHAPSIPTHLHTVNGVDRFEVSR
jgi:phage tail protein X